ncbi:uncharacterized protein SCODWIG_00509 [Saccharomycodes ludwigii]|uniref:Transmembrane protein 184 homolog YKR051W n=2 Tax=Saccharomycodes ludwigii TaxID=36035 RepID=A0A376B237_9ASCO|nr:uncharacterized protein SCODWIG_00509 [Saccharomycodes ludwigii]
MLDLAWDKPLIRHPIFILGKLLPPIDISDPKAFLNIKRGILQYVWFKPFYCLGMLIVELASGTDTSNKTAEWCVFLKNYLIIFYNISASLSLYDLALFWKCLYGDLAAHNPWPKFLCVKLIIFASYWQGTLIGILNHFGFWNGNDIDGTEDIGFVYQNAILCIEMIGFSVGHLIAFSFSPYTYKAMPNCGRMKFKFAVRDCFGIGDLAYDFKTTFLGKIYNYKNFDSIENVRLMRNNSHSSNRLRNARVTEGLRVINGGRDRYWIDTKNNSRIDNNRSSVLSLVGDQQQKLLYASNHQGYDSICSIESSTIRTDTGSNIGSEDLITTQSDMIHQNLNSIESEPLVDILEGVDSKYVPQDPNYPVTWDVKGYKYTTDIERLRDSLVSR